MDILITKLMELAQRSPNCIAVFVVDGRKEALESMLEDLERVQKSLHDFLEEKKLEYEKKLEEEKAKADDVVEEKKEKKEKTGIASELKKWVERKFTSPWGA